MNEKVIQNVNLHYRLMIAINIYPISMPYWKFYMMPSVTIARSNCIMLGSITMTSCIKLCIPTLKHLIHRWLQVCKVSLNHCPKCIFKWNLTKPFLPKHPRRSPNRSDILLRAWHYHCRALCNISRDVCSRCVSDGYLILHSALGWGPQLQGLLLCVIYVRSGRPVLTINRHIGMCLCQVRAK